MRNRGILRAVLPVLMLGACASGGGGGGNQRAPEEATYVVVDNRSQYDMTIYVVRDSGQRVRIGRATSVSRARLLIPPDLLFGPTSLRFLADPLAGGRSPVSHQIVITPGEQITLTIPPF